MDLISMYALKIEDSPTEEQITESVKNQMEQFMIMERINKKQQITDFQGYLNKTIEELKAEYDLLNNQ